MKDQNQSTNIVPSRNGPHWSSCLVTMLIPAAMKAAPVKYAQNKPPRQPSRHQAGDNAENEEMVNTETTDEAPKRYGPNPVNLSNTLSHRREPEPPAGRVPAKVRAEPHIGRVSKKTVRVPTLIGFAATLDTSRSSAESRNRIPNRIAVNRARTWAAMLRSAARRGIPVRYAKNGFPGNQGTPRTASPKRAQIRFSTPKAVIAMP